MGMFDFQESDGSVVVSRYFWVYWTISIPLTLFVMVTWLIWFRWQERREKKRVDDEEAPFREGKQGKVE